MTTSYANELSRIPLHGLSFLNLCHLFAFPNPKIRSETQSDTTSYSQRSASSSSPATRKHLPHFSHTDLKVNYIAEANGLQ